MQFDTMCGRLTVVDKKQLPQTWFVTGCWKETVDNQTLYFLIYRPSMLDLVIDADDAFNGNNQVLVLCTPEQYENFGQIAR